MWYVGTCHTLRFFERRKLRGGGAVHENSRDPVPAGPANCCRVSRLRRVETVQLFDLITRHLHAIPTAVRFGKETTWISLISSQEALPISLVQVSVQVLVDPSHLSRVHVPQRLGLEPGQSTCT